MNKEQNNLLRKAIADIIEQEGSLDHNTVSVWLLSNILLELKKLNKSLTKKKGKKLQKLKEIKND